MKRRTALGLIAIGGASAVATRFAVSRGATKHAPGTIAPRFELSLQIPLSSSQLSRLTPRMNTTSSNVKQSKKFCPAIKPGDNSFWTVSRAIHAPLPQSGARRSLDDEPF